MRHRPESGRHAFGFLACVAFLCAATAPASASPPASASGSAASTPNVFTLRFDNDTFAGLDRWYSSHLAAHLTLQTRVPELQLRFGLGQVLYTPRNIQFVDAPTRDHAFGAWLFADLEALWRTGVHHVSLGLRAGVVGPAAGGEPVQDAMHRVLGVRRPQGWANQLPNQAAFVVAPAWAAAPTRTIGGLDLFFVGAARADLGNAFGRVRAGAGVGLSFGVNAGARIALLEARFVAGHRCPRLCGAVFVGGSIDGVWRDLFVEADGAEVVPNLERRAWVAAFRFGFVLHRRRAWVRYSHVRQTRTFDAPDAPFHPRSHHWGSLTVGVPW